MTIEINCIFLLISKALIELINILRNGGLLKKLQ